MMRCWKLMAAMGAATEVALSESGVSGTALAGSGPTAQTERVSPRAFKVSFRQEGQNLTWAEALKLLATDQQFRLLLSQQLQDH
ncbi:unnamed protein product [Effrenium voratum]|nr:unnamed protein product [Effrenium voratum]